MRPRRVLATLVVCLAIGALGALVVGSLAGGGSVYTVRVVFDNASFVVPGEEVKVAGVNVGTIAAVALTQQNKAAVVLKIDNRRYVPFRTDAHCEIGLESLLGEQFVQCTPTQAQAGSPPPSALPAIASGPNKGEHLLPVQNTTTPVGTDLIADTTRLPQQQRLQLIIAGLGVGLDSNGQELNAALLRADPALEQTDRVIAVLAGQNRLLGQLTTESDRILAPLAAQRAHVGGFVQHVGAVALAASREGSAIEQNLRSLPPFLHQLRPAAARLTGLTEQMTPALQTLQSHARAINASVRGLGPLAKSSIPAIQTLGRVAQRGESVFPRINPLAHELLSLGTPLVPVAGNLASVSQSFDNAGGIEDVMRFIYYYTGAVNGEDALGHYVRSSFEIGGCSARSSTPGPGCGSTFATTTVGGSFGHASALSKNELASTLGATKLAPTPAEAKLAGDPATSTTHSSTAIRALLDYLLRP